MHGGNKQRHRTAVAVGKIQQLIPNGGFIQIRKTGFRIIFLGGIAGGLV